ncbi:TetR family transcriptional regulator [Stackebrandtia endophytica]|uniref:TetR family transcriptional regulator n=1 Tax=Stackebrandtia endophytica TaxID=1496996 RepID=A0A543ATH8_9ACTN|nr:TetR/AcrR family transcriptional regulator [Stackebrandtia endophytica]TQL75883.1 TetR family transcriptional regulator [Stackebrandtia endophytica]
MSRRPRHTDPLSRDRIVTAAVEVADRQGFEAVSMRRVAEHLGSGTMSLYRHIADKDELIGAMVGHVTGRYAYPDRTGMSWRECLHQLARRDRQAFEDHPWMLAATATVTPAFGAESLASMEWALAALEPLELSTHEAARAIMVINNYVQGSTRIALGDRDSDATDDLGQNWRTRLGDVDLAEFPRLAQLIQRPPTDAGDDWFGDGLDLILDGIQQRANR